MKKTIFIWIIAVFVSVSMCTLGVAGEKIKIGIIGPMAFTPGQAQWNGALLAAEEINKKGGIKIGNISHQIELEKVDSNEFSNITDSLTAMERAITYHKVDFLAGGALSEATLAMQDIAMDNKKIFLGVAQPVPNCALV